MVSSSHTRSSYEPPVYIVCGCSAEKLSLTRTSLSCAGVSGPFWYAAGATIQVLLFAILAIEIKRKCPAIHTMLEIVQARWGPPAHLTFLFFGLLTCLIVTAMLILGGAATINALTV